MKTGHVLSTIFALVVGCAAPPKQTIHFDSQPAGARVFYGLGPNDKFAEPKTYLGTTPFQWAPDQDGKGQFKIPGALVYSTFVPPSIIFEARWTNGSPERVTFHGGSIVSGPDKIPPGIFFQQRQ